MEGLGLLGIIFWTGTKPALLAHSALLEPINYGERKIERIGIFLKKKIFLERNTVLEASHYLTTHLTSVYQRFSRLATLKRRT